MQDAAQAAGETRIATILGDVPSYHTSPADAARQAVAAGVAMLVLTHFTPPPDNALLRNVFRRGMDAVPPQGVVLGDDGTLVVMPTGTKTIEVTRFDP
jgi:ribonuclease Z